MKAVSSKTKAPTDRFSLSPSRLARYFFHDCDRHLRFFATPSSRRKADGLPSRPHEESPVTRAILDAGYEWEERVVEKKLKGRVRVRAGKEKLRDRTFSAEETIKELKGLKPGQAVYQSTLNPPQAFLERYGLDPDVVEFRPCRPDLIVAGNEGGERRLRVVDVKASVALKSSHRVQVGLYSMILRDVLEEAGLDVEVDANTAGVWLFDQDAPEEFELNTATSALEGFLRDRLMGILERPVEELGWHLHYRCEWCEYFDHCRQEAERVRSVSLVPYLTVGGRRYLHEAPWPDGTAVETLDDFDKLLRRKDADDILDACGSLRGRTLRMRDAVKALKTGKVVAHGGSSLAFPKRENVRVVVTLQSDPVSGEIYAAGFRRSMGKEVYKTGVNEEIFVAETRDDCAAVHRDFLHALHGELMILHEYNEGREWKDQKSLQTYVFDSYEAALLNNLLFDALEDDDEETKEAALRLLFHFQSESLAKSEEHPQTEVPFPVVILTSAIRALVALPAPLVIRLQDALEALPSPSFKYTYATKEYFSFELSNALKSDVIFQAWNKKLPERAEWVRGELSRRLIVANTVVDGLREKVGDKLFAWPPKFALPGVMDFSNPDLSRLSFVVRYESLMGALGCRTSRVRPWPERIREAISIPLRCLGGDRWKPVAPLDATTVEADGFLNRLLVPAGDEGELGQMSYDDHRNRRAMWAPKKGPVRIASIEDVDIDPETGLVRELVLRIKPGKEHESFEKNSEAVLHPRFTDFISKHVIERLAVLDNEPESDFVRLLHDPIAFARPVPEARKVLDAAKKLSKTVGFTASQARAFEQVAGNNLTLVWGPPGTGKTHFLAKAVLSLARAREAAGRPLRVAVTAFTHAAIENLLREIQDVAALSKSALGLDGIYKLEKVQSPRGVTLKKVMPDAAAALPGDETVVIGGTVYGFRKAIDAGLAPCDVLVIDEGSQLKLGETALATVALAHGGRIVIAGDDEQLPPIVQGEYPEPEDRRPGLHGSVFAYLHARDDEEKPFTHQLLENWRMNATLSRFPAETIYTPEYKPATKELAKQTLMLKPARKKRKDGVDEIADWLLDPAWPLAIGILEGIRATAENRDEAALVAHLSVALRERMLLSNEKTYPDTEKGDADFWRRGLFIVSPHHVQIRAIRRALSELREWESVPFVDTVDKMQGQQAESVIVSYGVSDAETALTEAKFIYSRNRLNVSVTRAQKKCIVFLPRPLLDPPFEVFSKEDAARGLAYMHDLVSFCRRNGEERVETLDTSLGDDAGRITLVRCHVDPRSR